MAGKLLTPTAAEIAGRRPDVAAEREKHAGCYSRTLAICRHQYVYEDVPVDELARRVKLDCPMACEALFDFVAQHNEAGRA